jgi:hypothetical protein
MSHQSKPSTHYLYSNLNSVLVSKHRLRTKTQSDIPQFFWAYNVLVPHSPYVKSTKANKLIDLTAFSVVSRNKEIAESILVSVKTQTIF